MTKNFKKLYLEVLIKIKIRRCINRENITVDTNIDTLTAIGYLNKANNNLSKALE